MCPEATPAAPAETDDPDELVAGILDDARTAMEAIADYDQAALDQLARAIGWAVYREERCRELSELAVETTGLGDADDKYRKKRRKIPGVLEDILATQTVGVVDKDPAAGRVDIAKPVGVVGGVVPSTNPGATPTVLAMLAVNCRNAIVLSPSPRGLAVCEQVVEYVREELAAAGAPPDLVQMLPAPVSKPKTYALMEQVDLLQVTGSADNVRAGQESGTPNYCVGQGNPVAIVDETADVTATAERIATSQQFDNGTSCSSEGNAAVVADVYDETLAALADAGGYLCTGDERRRLCETLFPDGERDPETLARPATDIADRASIDVPDETEFLLTRGRGVGPDHPLSGEKLAPVLNVFRVPDVDRALTLASCILAYEGAGHSANIQTTDSERARRAGERLGVARLLVNQPNALANGGHYRNGLTSTLSEGTGTWGGNQLAENVGVEQFYQTTTVARPIEDASPPDADALFAPYVDG
ncbi:aldehyde dehydrogenase family protein [Halosegnis sp.]|uniref:aldehyde dehydrogenase family protein n=1 Tax=Halosegnis sp. TaxID=2864959 RepID=UPI0035D43B6A